MCLRDFTNTSLFVSGLVILCLAFSVFPLYSLVVSTSAIDCPERLLSQMTYYVWSGSDVKPYT